MIVDGGTGLHMNEENQKISVKACVGISAIVGLACVLIVVFVTIFSKEHLHVAAWMVAPLCLMGSALGMLTCRSRIR